MCAPAIVPEVNGLVIEMDPAGFAVCPTGLQSSKFVLSSPGVLVGCVLIDGVVAWVVHIPSSTVHCLAFSCVDATAAVWQPPHNMLGWASVVTAPAPSGRFIVPEGI